MNNISKRIYEKENYPEISNNSKHQNTNKSLTQLVSLQLINKKNDQKEIKSYVTNLQRPLVFQKKEEKKEEKNKTLLKTENSNIETQSNDLCKLIVNYSEPILEYYVNSQYPQNSLQNHTISSNLRAKMIDWMVEVLTSYKCKDQTFFLSVFIMDQYLSKTIQNHTPQDLHLIGVTTMFMASKYEEIYPVKLQIVQEKIAHKKLTKEEIKVQETNILSTLDFNINYTTILDIINIVLSILNLNNQLYKTTVYLAKMALYDYEFSNQFTYVQLACASLILSAKIVEQIDKQLESEIIIPLIIQTLKLDNEEAMNCSNKMLIYAKGFESKYPNLENLKKFNKFQLTI